MSEHNENKNSMEERELMQSSNEEDNSKLKEVYASFHPEISNLVDDGGGSGGGIPYNEAVSIVTEIYKTHLGRAPDAGGLDYWVTRLTNNGSTAYEVLTEIMNSDEAHSYTRSLESSVNSIYQQELGRSADSGGLAYYVDKLRIGYSIYDVRTEISVSQEAIDYRKRIIASTPLPVINVPQNVVPYYSQISSFYKSGAFTSGFYQGMSLQQIVDTYSRYLNGAGTYMSTGELDSYAERMAGSIYSYHGSFNPEGYDPIGFGKDGFNRETGLDINGNDRFGFNPATQLEFVKNSLQEATGYIFNNVSDMGSLLNSASNVINNSADRAAVNQFLQTFSIPYTIQGNQVIQQVPVSHVRPQPQTVIDVPTYAPPPPPPRITPRPSSSVSPRTVVLAGADRSIIDAAFLKLPAYIIQILNEAGISVKIVRDTIVEAFPALNNVIPRGWRVSWNTVPGIFDPNTSTIVLASSSVNRTGSGDFRLHEIGHAYDWAVGGASRTDGFTNAWMLDRVTLGPYYNQLDTVAAREETYAEAFSAYYSRNTSWFSNRPNLQRYFQSMPSPR